MPLDTYFRLKSNPNQDKEDVFNVGLVSWITPKGKLCLLNDEGDRSFSKYAYYTNIEPADI